MNTDKRNYRKGGRRNWRIRFIDETEYLSEDAIAALPAGSKLISAYIFDPGEVTHICSFQGSQWHVGICSFVVPPSAAAWEAWRDDYSATQDTLLCELEERPDNDYFADRGEADSYDSGIRVRRFRTGDTWIDCCTAAEHEGTPGQTNYEEAASELIESECNSCVTGIYYEINKQAVTA